MSTSGGSLEISGHVEKGKSMKYGVISIDAPESVNDANILIEWAAKQMLGLGEAAVSVSVFKMPTDEQIDQLNQCDFVLLPGSTLLAKGDTQSLALAALPKIKVPKICSGASAWGPRLPPYTEILKHITPPVGCRDPYTFGLCQMQDIEAMIIGCPVMHLPQRETTKPDKKFSIVSFGRDECDVQMEIYRGLYGTKIVALQEPGVEAGFARSMGLDSFNYKDSELVMDYFSRCDAVYSGRLHGILPAISQRKPICFFGDDKDTRFSLFGLLDIPVHPIINGRRFDAIWPLKYGSRVEGITNNFKRWMKFSGF